MGDLKYAYQKFLNIYYKLRSVCQKCHLNTDSLVRTEDGPYYCVPCVIKFNHDNLNKELDTYLCITCGCYYHQRNVTKTSLSLMYCPICQEIQRMLRDFKFYGPESNTTTPINNEL